MKTRMSAGVPRAALLLLISLLAMALPVTALAQEAVTLVSDKDDYAPFEVATLFGTGFWPGETVDLSVTISDPATGDVILADYQWAQVEASSDGQFVAEYTVPAEAAGMLLVATAMGLESGLVATATFTDSHFTLVSTSITTSGDDVTVSVTIGGGAPLPQQVEVNVSGIGNNLGLSSSDSIVWAKTFAGTCGTTYTLTQVQARRTSAAGHTPGGAGFTTWTTGNASSFLPKSATTAPCPPTNQPPVITCLDPTAELGAIVGCLADDGFEKTLLACYDFDPDSGKVTATILDGLTPLAIVDVATVTDPDGDDFSVLLDPECEPVTLVGPGFDSQGISVHVMADDGKANGLAEEDCGATVSGQIVYEFEGFRPPVSKKSTTVVKKGSTVPVKFRLYDCDGTEICTALGDGHVIKVFLKSGTAPSGDPINLPPDSDSGSSNSNGVLFRYSGTCGVDGNWIYNLSTKSGYSAGSTYLIRACLDDGTQPEVCISIK